MKRKYLNNITKLTIAALAVVSISSCQEEGGLAPEYMPDMYRSPSVEVYVDYGEIRGQRGDEKLINSMSARRPVAGTIARGYMPYTYENSAAGYELAGQNLTNPVPYSEEAVADGKELFGMFCVHCHGDKGQGDGTLVQRDKFPPIPTKFTPDLDLPEGKMFHTITYGKGLMGAHASQLLQEERWKLVHYIRAEFMGKAPVADTTAVEAPAEAPTEEVAEEAASAEESNETEQ